VFAVLKVERQAIPVLLIVKYLSNDYSTLMHINASICVVKVRPPKGVADPFSSLRLSASPRMAVAPSPYKSG